MKRSSSNTIMKMTKLELLKKALYFHDTKICLLAINSDGDILNSQIYDLELEVKYSIDYYYYPKGKMQDIIIVNAFPLKPTQEKLGMLSIYNNNFQGENFC